MHLPLAFCTTVAAEGIPMGAPPHSQRTGILNFSPFPFLLFFLSFLFGAEPMSQTGEFAVVIRALFVRCSPSCSCSLFARCSYEFAVVIRTLLVYAVTLCQPSWPPWLTFRYLREQRMEGVQGRPLSEGKIPRAQSQSHPEPQPEPTRPEPQAESYEYQFRSLPAGPT